MLDKTLGEFDEFKQLIFHLIPLKQFFQSGNES